MVRLGRRCGGIVAAETNRDRMARLPRFDLPGFPQHVIQRGNNRTTIFARHEDYRFFLECLTNACERYECDVHAYALLTNHAHLLMTPRTSRGVSKVMQSVGRRYVGYFNAVYRRTGTLWEGRYRASLVETERYLLTCYRYVELNPIRAGLAIDPSEYSWSSHRANAWGHVDPLVTPHALYDSLDRDANRRREAYRALFEIPLEHSLLEEIRETTNKRWVLGSNRFREEIAALASRRTQPLVRGGPRAGSGRPRVHAGKSMESDPNGFAVGQLPPEPLRGPEPEAP
jgi:putative transposase